MIVVTAAFASLNVVPLRPTPLMGVVKSLAMPKAPADSLPGRVPRLTAQSNASPASRQSIPRSKLGKNA